MSRYELRLCSSRIEIFYRSHDTRNLWVDDELTESQELFDAAEEYQPQLHRGTYFSLPEWFNPAYAEYGFGTWPGGKVPNSLLVLLC